MPFRVTDARSSLSQNLKHAAGRPTLQTRAVGKFLRTSGV